MNPSSKDIRDFITEAFSDEEFSDLFCADYFPQVRSEFAAGMPFVVKAQRLIDYCQRRRVMDNLLADLRKERPALYANRFAQVTLKPQEVPAFAPTTRNPRQIFISHAHQDAEFAHRLASDLKERGWAVWIAPDSIRPGERFVGAIERGLDESGIFLALLTQAAYDSPWVKQEDESAIELNIEGKMRLITLFVQPCKVRTILGGYQRVNFVRSYEASLIELLTALDSWEAISPVKVSGEAVPDLDRAKTREKVKPWQIVTEKLSNSLMRIRKIPTWGWLVTALSLVTLLVGVPVIQFLFAKSSNSSSTNISGPPPTIKVTLTPWPSPEATTALMIASAATLTSTDVPMPRATVTSVPTITPKPSVAPSTATSIPPTPDLRDYSRKDRISGKVTYRGKEVPDIPTTLYSGPNCVNVIQRTKTDAQGRYIFVGINPGHYSIGINFTDDIATSVQPYINSCAMDESLTISNALEKDFHLLTNDIQVEFPTPNLTIGNVTPVFRWKPYPGATGYSVGVFQKSPTEKRIVENMFTENTIFALPQTLSPGSEYYVYIGAFDASGQIAYAVVYFKIDTAQG